MRTGDRASVPAQLHLADIGREPFPGGAPGLQIRREALSVFGGFDFHCLPPVFEKHPRRCDPDGVGRAPGSGYPSRS